MCFVGIIKSMCDTLAKRHSKIWCGYPGNTTRLQVIAFGGMPYLSGNHQKTRAVVGEQYLANVVGS